MAFNPLATLLRMLIVSLKRLMSIIVFFLFVFRRPANGLQQEWPPAGRAKAAW
jgi:hypothetical protein